jgi:hypothetical protein
MTASEKRRDAALAILFVIGFFACFSAMLGAILYVYR